MDRAVFDAVQEKLTANRNGAKVRRAASAALLIGRIFDDRGHPMTPSTAKKASIRYRYLCLIDARPRPQERGRNDRGVADTLPPAFLAPGLVRAVIEARLPRGISTRSIAEPELEWSRQWTTLGISARPASLRATQARSGMVSRSQTRTNSLISQAIVVNRRAPIPRLIDGRNPACSTL